MKKLTLSILGLSILGLASCNTPYGTGTERMVPRADVESLERQAPVTPAPDDSYNARTAADYGSGRRYGLPFFY